MKSKTKNLCLYLLVAVMVLGLFFAAPAVAYADDFVPVTDITGVPATATIGTPLQLAGTVSPNGATNKDITWSIVDAGDTGATITDGKLNATAAGTVTVMATIAGGMGGLSASQISAGAEHAAMLATDGSLWTWGRNQNFTNVKTLGRDAAFRSAAAMTPGQVEPGTTWKAVASGGVGASDTRIAHTIALKTDGTIWSWGDNIFGQLGDGTNSDINITYASITVTTDRGKSAPVQIGADNDWKYIAAGASGSAAIKNDGSLWMWGRNNYGQLGIGIGAGPTKIETEFDRNTPQRVGDDNDWAAVELGSITSLALKTDGTLWAWGGVQSGMLGDPDKVGATEWVNVPQQIMHTDEAKDEGAKDNDWDKLFANGSHAMAIKKDGSLWAWGYNNRGQLGVGGISVGEGYVFAHRYTPTRVGTDNDWDTVSIGDRHTLAVKKDGTLWAWGHNNYGQVGDGTTTTAQTGAGYNDKIVPVQIGDATDWASVSAGNDYSLATKKNGTVWAWGRNNEGQLGTGGRSTTAVEKEPILLETAGADYTKVFTITVSAGGGGEEPDGCAGCGNAWWIILLIILLLLIILFIVFWLFFKRTVTFADIDDKVLKKAIAVRRFEFRPEYIPVREDGHVFSGWYFDKGYAQKAPDVIKVDEDIILYAKWT
ncbi:MAG: Ig-like domain-containing protein [Firmicutes bacterium]|nr:Ig-like domain-containing protein [Bacillota bacterium]